MKVKIGAIYEVTILRDDYTHFHQMYLVKEGQDPYKIAKLYEEIRLGKGYKALLETVIYIKDEYDELIEDNNTKNKEISNDD